MDKFQGTKENCSSCNDGYTGKTEVIIDSVILKDNGQSIIEVDMLLVGKRYENKAQYDFIRNNYNFIGIGTCKKKNKQIDLWADDSGHIYGTSKVLPYRYFELKKEVII